MNRAEGDAVQLRACFERLKRMKVQGKKLQILLELIIHPLFLREGQQNLLIW